MKFLDAESKEDLEMVAEKNETIKKAVATLAKLSEDEKTRMAYDNRQKYIWDQTARENEARESGREEGKTEGELSKAREISLRLLKKGLSYEEIAEVANISIELIKQWENCPT
jgi:predicted transposase/invertase (TIGR01784 family)